MKKEDWKPVINFEDSYIVNNLGEVKSLDRMINIRRGNQRFKFNKKGKTLKPKLTHDGYFETTLIKNQKRKYIRTHRIVAFAFISNKLGKPCINHKDGNKLNNNINNLEWVTVKENTIHAYKNNLIKIRRGESLSDLKDSQVREIRKLHKNKTLTQRQIAKKFGVGKNCIWHIVHRKTWKHIK